MVYTFFDKRTSGSGIENENILNQELAEELHEPINRKCNKKKYNHLLKIIFRVLTLLICN